MKRSGIASKLVAWVGVALVGAMVAPAPAAAEDKLEDFVAAFRDYASDGSAAWVLSKYVTFKLGDKCWAKLPNKDLGALHTASFFTRDIVAWAKDMTGDDWSAIENQGGDKDKNLALVEPMMEAFKSRFSMTVSVEGNDCDARSNSLWLRYWSTLATSLKSYLPKAKKVAITLNVTAKAKDVTVEVSPDNSSFVFTAPRDIEVTGWSDKLEKPFRRIKAGLPDEFSFMAYEYTGRYWNSWVLSKLTTFKVGKKCLARMPDREKSALHMASFYTRDIGEYAKLVGAEDWDRIEQQSANEPEFNRELVAKDMDEFAKRFQVAVSVEGDDCDVSHGALWLKHWGQIALSLKTYPPKAKKVSIKLDVKAKAKDVTVTANKDGSSITIVAPRDLEPTGWSDKYDAAFKRVARKQ